MNDEILIVPKWEWVMWDKELDIEFRHAVTGTWMNSPRLERRYIQNGEKQVHILDGGVLETMWRTTWVDSISYTLYWKECPICGDEFDVEEL
jgi:hypothetical protein